MSILDHMTHFIYNDREVICFVVQHVIVLSCALKFELFYDPPFLGFTNLLQLCHFGLRCIDWALLGTTMRGL